MADARKQSVGETEAKVDKDQDRPTGQRQTDRCNLLAVLVFPIPPTIPPSSHVVRTGL